MSGKERSNHKYYARIQVGNVNGRPQYRYFYTAEQLRAYQNVKNGSIQRTQPIRAKIASPVQRTINSWSDKAQSLLSASLSKVNKIASKGKSRIASLFNKMRNTTLNDAKSAVAKGKKSVKDFIARNKPGRITATHNVYVGHNPNSDANNIQRVSKKITATHNVSVGGKSSSKNNNNTQKVSNKITATHNVYTGIRPSSTSNTQRVSKKITATHNVYGGR